MVPGGLKVENYIYGPCIIHIWQEWSLEYLWNSGRSGPWNFSIYTFGPCDK